MTAPVIRPARAADAAGITALYNHYVAHSPATLQDIPATAEDFLPQLAKPADAAPFIVADAGGEIAGYAYADIMKSRCGYRHAYENSIYVAPASAGRGIGTALMQALLTALRDTPAHKVVAVISLPNAVSVRLHERHGFTHCGTLPAIGWKFNTWVDCGYWALQLKDGTPNSKSGK